MVFERGRERKRKREWKGEKGRIEEVKEIKYLGYSLQKNSGAEGHIKERLRRSIKAMVKMEYGREDVQGGFWKEGENV